MGDMSSNGSAMKLRTHTMAVSRGDSGEFSMVSVCIVTQSRQVDQFYITFWRTYPLNIWIFLMGFLMKCPDTPSREFVLP